MVAAPQWGFGPFRLDLGNSRLWHGTLEISLKPKTFAVLHRLVAHAGRLVTKEELFATVWPATAIGDAVLKVCVGEARKALEDTAKTPQYIATVHRRGYRFIAPVTAVEAAEAYQSYPPPLRPLHPAISRLTHPHARCWSGMPFCTVCRRRSSGPAPGRAKWCL
jgi:DNA-binding winged helix-turn-helix (wHTH) protein